MTRLTATVINLRKHPVELTSSSLKLSHLPSYEALATKQSYQLPLSQSEFLHKPPAHQQGSFPITFMKSHLFKLCFPFVCLQTPQRPSACTSFRASCPSKGISPHAREREARICQVSGTKQREDPLTDPLRAGTRILLLGRAAEIPAGSRRQIGKPAVDREGLNTSHSESPAVRA